MIGWGKLEKFLSEKNFAEFEPKQLKIIDEGS